MKLRFKLDTPILYRYCDPLGIDILKSLRLKVTLPAEFNDPFEFLPKVETDFSREQIAKKMSHTRMLRSFWKEMGKPEEFEVFRKRYLDTLHAKGANHLGRAMKAMEQLASDWRDGIVAFMGAKFGIICYSEVPDDILMWAHYTRSHQGFVVGFDARHPFLRRSNSLMPVVYRSERFGATYDDDGAKVQDSELAIFRSKSLHWSYEKEWRQFFDVKKCTPMLTESGGTRLFQRLPPKAIATIILGLRCSFETTMQIAEALDSPDLKHVQVQQATLHDRDFRISLRKL